MAKSIITTDDLREFKMELLDDTKKLSIKQSKGELKRYLRSSEVMELLQVSVGISLFQGWNSSRFAIEFYVNQKDLMFASKIVSKSTYHRCVTELNTWNYLSYFPSNNPYKGSKIKMPIFGTNDNTVSEQFIPKLGQLAGQYRPKFVPLLDHNRPILEQAIYQYRPTCGQALVSTINNNKQVNNIKQPKGCQEVKLFLLKKKFNADEGKKFFEYYKNRDWKTSGGNDIRDWRAKVINGMDRTAIFDLGNNPNKKTSVPNQGQLTNH
ncbi:conserved hypothetical protein [Formosa agariphila KMM 3901]|uniref:Uncharacterized protein n=1 Tax=Formosa agariphila (strain DSM 15362 / KCTC 12365 / LMG 23005 / KMM 3901 / M-2Alg 35-1) TaxID=1347342 RepID=T2KPI0_FORAG|nr:conserved hypothetical protein [Formosa agariphila KMM 3901]